MCKSNTDKRYPRTILATACIPWTEKYEVNEKIFRRQIRYLVSNDIRYIYLFGTAGEGYAVTDKQYELIVKIFADEMDSPELHPMVGLISLSLPSMLERIEIAYNYGICDFQFSLPSWGTLSDKELFTFIHQLCDPWPDCRFLHYNTKRCKRLLGIREYKKIAEEIRNFVGVKYSTSNINTILDIAKTNCQLRFFITELGFAYGSLIGDFGFLISIANSNIKRAWKYFRAGVNKNEKTLLSMQKELFLMQKKVVEIVGSSKIDGSYDKLYAKIIDKNFPLRLLSPYTGADEKQFENYFNFLEKNFSSWIKSNDIDN